MNKGARLKLNKIESTSRELKFHVDGTDLEALAEAIRQTREAFPEIRNLMLAQRKPSFNVMLIGHERRPCLKGGTRHHFHYYGEWSFAEDVI